MSQPARFLPYSCLAALGAAAIVSASGCGSADARQSTEGENTETLSSDLYEGPGATLWPAGLVPICFKTFATSAETVWMEWALRNSWSSVARIDFLYSPTCPFPGQTNYVEVTLADQFAGSDGGLQDIVNHGSMGGNTTIGIPKTGPCLSSMSFCKGDACTDVGFADSAETFQAVAVHEIGHALGFAHEHQRLDAPTLPPGCLKPKPVASDFPNDAAFEAALSSWNLSNAPLGGGSMLTSYYDPDSIMNYCRGVTATNPTPEPYLVGYFAAERISPGDALGAANAYGARVPPWVLVLL